MDPAPDACSEAEAAVFIRLSRQLPPTPFVTGKNNSAPAPRRSVRRWIVGAIIIAILILVMQEVLDPYDERGYMAVSHGDHTHYVPRDRDPDAPMSNFPVVYPAPNERILPDGRVTRVSPDTPGNGR